MRSLAAFVLAGGKSTRMGRDKALLDFQGRTLLNHALDLARTLTPDVKVVGDPSKFSAFGNVVEDVYRDCGPLGGIHAALRANGAELNLMLAVDTPFVEARFLQWLVKESQNRAAVVTVPRAGGGFQPLCAVYCREFMEVAERALQAGNNKIDPLFGLVETHVVEEADLIARGFSPEMFRNLNTPEEWEKATGLR